MLRSTVLSPRPVQTLCESPAISKGPDDVCSQHESSMGCTYDKAAWSHSRFACWQGSAHVGGEFVDAYLRRTRCRSRGHLSHDQAIADAIGLGRCELQEPHRDLYHAWTWR